VRSRCISPPHLTDAPAASNLDHLEKIQLHV
jgi:hypothetical protein